MIQRISGILTARSPLWAPLLAGGLLMACGQDSSFFGENGQEQTKSSGAAPTGSELDDSTTPGSADATAGADAADGPAADAGDETPVEGAADAASDETPAEAPAEDLAIPDASEGDLAALHKCLKQWKNHPFKGNVQNYQKIAASVTVGGFGNAINDTESTDEPFLVLITAGVNVLGLPIYNLMNPNGYYCMKVNVNVATALNVKLHCSGRLADQAVNVNVGSTQNDTTSTVGVHVLSNVNVETVRPEGATCIR